MFTIKIVRDQYENYVFKSNTCEDYYPCQSFKVSQDTKCLSAKDGSQSINIPLENPEFNGTGEVKSVYVENQSGKTVYSYRGVERVIAKKKITDKLNLAGGEL